jgi:hypothetical protein
MIIVSDYLQAFCSEYNTGVFIKNDYKWETPLTFEYAEDFDYADGEEEANGSIYYYIYDNQLIFTREIYAGDGESFHFTKYGFNYYTVILNNYFDWLLNKIKLQQYI